MGRARVEASAMALVASAEPEVKVDGDVKRYSCESRVHERRHLRPALMQVLASEGRDDYCDDRHGH